VPHASSVARDRATCQARRAVPPGETGEANSGIF
jgi:hypothetical protein